MAFLRNTVTARAILPTSSRCVVKGTMTLVSFLASRTMTCVSRTSCDTILDI